ncbi:MAG TPA: carboxy terminal-processing peptidase [Opitutaceae bacterium]|nr:carboxy terminal-processing peptidase [Opitutaceae bacterium]
MTRSLVFARRPFSLALFALLAAAAAFARTDRTFTTSPELSVEARTFVRLLEEVHYNRDAVKTKDYIQAVPDYMTDLDGQHLFFLASDKAAFIDRYQKNLYWNVSQLGNLDAAYDIFNVYDARVEARVNWIFNELKKNIDLNTNETYQLDRSKAAWPANMAEADALWRRYLKSEILYELLSQKVSAQAASKNATPTPAPKPPAGGKPSPPATAPAPAQSPADQARAAQDKAIADAKEAVRKRYERMLKNLDELEGSDLTEMFLTSIAGLYDPHSTYFTPEDYQEFNVKMSLSLVGIGALLSLEDDYCVVQEIIPGGPADLSKLLHPNDKIISVTQGGADPVDIIGMRLTKIVNLIRGPQGTKVRLTIIPATDPSARKEIVLTRDVVKLNFARAHAAIFDVPAADGKSTMPIGVISLPSFYGSLDSDDSGGEKSSATQDVAALIKQLKAAGIKGLVLDLRHNGGGLLSEAINLTGLFIGHGPVVQVRDFQGDIKVDSDEDPSIAYTGPLAVLVDRFSASASEIVTGALQDYGRAIIIGDSSTHGKGTVQTVYDMRDIIPQLMDSSIKKSDKTGVAKITVQKFYLPDGSSTQLKGVVPDIVLPSVDDYLPIGEKDLLHPLSWDDIPSSFYDGSPLDPKIIQTLRADSQARQQTLEEFNYLKTNVDWFKAKEEQKYISLNLEDREKEQAVDDTFRKKMTAEKKQLAKQDYKFRDFRVGPPLPPRLVAPKKPDDQTPSDEMDDDDDENSDTFSSVDVPLRESLRVVEDAIALGQNRQLWVDQHAPLTAAVATKK